MTWYPIQKTFQFGEVGQGFYSQTDTPVYQGGLAKCRNMWPTPQGNVATRLGLKYEKTIVDNYGGGGRVFSIDVDANDRVVATFANKLCQVHTSAEFVRQGNFVSNYDLRSTGSWVEYEGSYNSLIIHEPNGAIPGTAYSGYYALACHDGSGAYNGRAGIRQKVPVSPVTGGLTIKYYVFLPGDQGFTRQATPRVRVGTSGHGSGELYDVTHTIEPGQGLEVSTAIANSDNLTGNVYVEVLEEANGASSPNWRFAYVAFLGLFYDQPPLTEIPPFAIPYENDELDAIQYVSNPHINSSTHTNQSETVFVHTNHAPRQLILTPTGNWEFQAVPFVGENGTNETPPWFDPEAGKPAQFPRAVGTHQGRVFYAGTGKHPQTVWASAPGNWYELRKPETQTATSPIWYTLTANGAVQWLQGSRMLLHGTANAEHIIEAAETTSGSGNNLITALNVNSSENSRYGSSHVQSELVGTETFYISGDRRKVRKIDWEDLIKGWKAIDMTYTAPHIAGGRVTRMAFSKDPVQVVWCPLYSGAVAAMTYEPGLQIFGWSQHSTKGEIVDVATSRYGGYDFVQFLVRRQINGVDRLNLEAMRIDPSLDNIYLDSWKWQTSATPTNVVAGLGHLEGERVIARAEGRELGEYTVESGQITVGSNHTDIIVGIPYYQEVQTLPATPLEGKSSGFGASKNWSRVGVRIAESVIPRVNGDQYKGKVDDPAGLVAGDYHGHHTGWDDWAQITVSNDTSNPLRIVGVYGKLDDEDL